MLNDDLLRVIMSCIRAGRYEDAIDNIALLDGDAVTTIGRKARYALICKNGKLALSLLDRGFGLSPVSRG